MSLTVPFQTGMVIGRTYDVRTMSVMSDVFTEEALAKSSTTDRPDTVIQYHDINNCKDLNKVLGISGEFSLKAKTGMADGDALGSYLKDDSSRENTIDILTNVHVTTVEETMTRTDLKRNWKHDGIGTHYIRTITYGGKMLANIRIHASDSKQLQDIKGQLGGAINFGGGGGGGGVLDASAKAELKKLDQTIQHGSELHISLHATTLIDHAPRDVASMLETIDAFNGQVENQNKGKGSPLTCELVPLKTLDPTIPEVVRNKSTCILLDDLEEKYEDVRQAKSKLDTLLSTDEINLSDEQEKKAGEIDANISTVFACFNQVISKLDVTKDGEQMNPAFKIYAERKGASGFTRIVTRFEKSLKEATTEEEK